MITKEIYKKIDGDLFSLMIQNAAASLKENVDIVNNLNVFPIPDGDTGENMYLTIKSGLDALNKKNEGDLSTRASIAAQGMLLGARGNSGVILSQLFYGLSKGLNGLQEATLEEFANALNEGVKHAYSAVAHPVEGTILTVAREASEYVKNKVSEENDFSQLLVDFLKEMKKSLDRTPELLPVLKESGVVDSGGAGLVYITEGFYKAISGEKLELIDTNNASNGEIDLSAFDENTEMVFGYCTEVLLRLQTSKVDVENFDVNIIIDYLSTIGDSIVAFKTGTAVKIHVHTLTPYKVLEFLQKYGEYLKVKIENMTLQHNESTEVQPMNLQKKPQRSRRKFGSVTVANGEGLIKLFEELGVDYVIKGGQTNNPSSEDFVEAFDYVNADVIYVFPNNSNIILAAKQAAEIYKDSQIIVIESKSIGQGYSALSMLDYSSEDIDKITESLNSSMQDVVTGLISKASRTTTVNGIDIVEGNYIGFTNKTMLTSKENKIDTLEELLEKIELQEKGFALIIYGKTVSDQEKVATNKLVSEKYSSIELYEINGEQDVYDFIIITE